MKTKMAKSIVAILLFTQSGLLSASIGDYPGTLTSGGALVAALASGYFAYDAFKKETDLYWAYDVEMGGELSRIRLEYEKLKNPVIKKETVNQEVAVSVYGEHLVKESRTKEKYSFSWLRLYQTEIKDKEVARKLVSLYRQRKFYTFLSVASSIIALASGAKAVTELTR